jgi:Tfp pilus assembly PilM family ATPase
MARSFPPDVVVLDTDTLLHARFARGRKNPRLVQSKAWRLPAGTFTAAAVSPTLADAAGLAEALRRMRMETGRWEKVSLLLPDSWFRINIVELPSLPDREQEAQETVRWSLKRTLPIPPEQLRVAWTPLSRNGKGATVLVLSALDTTIAALEKTFGEAGFDPVLIEPLGLNLWNAVATHDPSTTGDRLLLYVRDSEFTTAVFRGSQPLFIRSRNISGERTIEQEIRLSASYLRDSLSVESFASSYVAGAWSAGVQEILASEFNTQVRPVALRDYVEDVPSGVSGYEAELTSCTGVFTG